MSEEILDLDLSEFEVVDDTPSKEGEKEREERIYQKSSEIIKTSMKDVIQEILITLGDGSTHIVYITSLSLNDDQSVSMEFSTLSENRKKELAPHVEKCVKIQIENELNKKSKRKRFW